MKISSYLSIFFLLSVCMMSVASASLPPEFQTTELVSLYTCLDGCGGDRDQCLNSSTIENLCDRDAAFCENLHAEPLVDRNTWFSLGMEHFDTNPDLAHAAFVFSYIALFLYEDRNGFIEVGSPLAALIALEGDYASLNSETTFESLASHSDYDALIESGREQLHPFLAPCADLIGVIVGDPLQNAEQFQAEIDELTRQIERLQKMADAM